MAIGASRVGTVVVKEKCQKAGSVVAKGDEVGLFQFGGSSIIVAFEKGRIEFDEDLLSMSRHQVMVVSSSPSHRLKNVVVGTNQQYEQDVEVGMPMGKATRPAAKLLSSQTH